MDICPAYFSSKVRIFYQNLFYCKQIIFSSKSNSFFILVSFHLKKFQNKVHFDEKFFLKKYFFVLCLLSLSNVYIAFRIFSTRGRGSQKWPKSFLHRKSMPPWLISFLWQLFERFYLLPLGILDILLGNFVDTCIGP